MTQPSQKLVTNSIRELRFLSGEMTQQSLANQVGVTRQTIVAIEQGRYAPSLEIAFRIAEVFDLGLEDVFHFKRKPPENLSSASLTDT